MTVPSSLVKAARFGWKWQWEQLMNSLAPSDKEGNYVRPLSDHQNTDIPSKDELLSKTQIELPTLIIGKSCPWAHRTWLVYKIKGLEDCLNLITAKPSVSEGKWKLSPSWLGCNYLDEVYKICGSPPSHRSTVPTLIDPSWRNSHNPKLLCNESAQLVKILDKWPTNHTSIKLYPRELSDEIDGWNFLLQSTVNDGVYKCGFARNQKSYNQASDLLFQSLNTIETSLKEKSPWLCGDNLTLADIRLFPTLIRWESVYMSLFNCSNQPLWTFPNIWQWRQRLFNYPKVQETCDAEIWRKDYFGNLFPLRPSGIIPSGPMLDNIVNAELPKIK